MTAAKQFLINNRWRLVTLGIATVLITLNLFRLYYTGYFTSDGVYGQNFVLNLQHHTHQEGIFSPDNYLLKAPFYWLILHIGLSPLASLVATLVVFTFSGYFSLYLGVILLNKTFRWFDEKYFALAFLYLTSMSQPYQYMMIANTRNVESGLTFLLLAPLAIAFTKGISRAYQVATVVAISLLLIDDPYFVYTMFVPLLAVIILSALLLKQKKRRGHWSVGLMILASIILAKIWKAVLGIRKLGIDDSNFPLKFLALGKAITNFKATVVALFLMGGLLDFHPHHLSPLSTYLNALIVAVLMLYSLGFIIFNLKNLAKDAWRIFIISIPWIITVLFWLQPTESTTNTRYMLLAVFGLPAVMAFLLNGVKRSKTLLRIGVFCVVLASLLNIQFSAQGLAVNMHLNAINEQIVQEVKTLGLTKGYTDYWSGNINTYFSGGNIYFLPVTCTNSRLLPMYWLVDSGGFTKVKVRRSFYLYDNQGYYTKGCSIGTLTAVYGKPAAIQVINSRYQVAIYNYDIGSKMNLLPYGPMPAIVE